MTRDMQAPCHQCPWRKDAKTAGDGYIGGSHASAYIGQAHGPFHLPCHMACDFNDPEWWKDKSFDVPQCAGAAIYRANVGVADSLPPQLHRLVGDKESVFSSPIDFVLHHSTESLRNDRELVEDISAVLSDPAGIALLVQQQLDRSTNRYKVTLKEDDDAQG